jgi:DNA-binding NtrC family response regulator
MEIQRIIGSAFDPSSSTVLVVDDEEGIRSLLTAWISSMGHHVIEADSAEAALRVMQSVPVHVAVCDILMPRQDGLWLIDELRRDYPSTAIVIATGLDELDPAVTLRPGVAAYVMKPFDPEAFTIALKVALAMQTVSRSI